MKIEEFWIKAFDKISLFLKCWLSQGMPEGVFILIHGLGEHVNRYNHWAKRFSNAGWVVAGIDLRGHGYSEGKRGNGSYQAYLKDIDTVFHFVNKRFGDIPKVLYGHSLGGNLALAYEISRKPEINKLIVTSPWLRLSKPPSNSVIYFSKILRRFLPAFRISNGLNYSQMSREKQVCDDYKNDPLVHNKISINSFLQIQEWASTILKNKHKINVPLLLLHGCDDQVTSWKGSYSFAWETSENTHFKKWDRCYHELHNEPCNEEVFDYIAMWLSNVQNSKLKSNVG
jgi:alpha-beta hydrolase superfamily lysophospholipase